MRRTRGGEGLAGDLGVHLRVLTQSCRRTSNDTSARGSASAARSRGESSTTERICEEARAVPTVVGAAGEVVPSDQIVQLLLVACSANRNHDH